MAAPNPTHLSQLETFRPGYPRYAALLSIHPAFHNVRRFTRMRMRLLLLAQDELSILEKTLDDIDATENCKLFLGCHQRDQNPARAQVLGQLKVSLAEYDTMLEQSRRTLSLPDAVERDIKSLKNWVDGTSCIARRETRYLDNQDLLSLIERNDTAISVIESLVEDFVFWFENCFRRWFPLASVRRQSKTTQDNHILLLGPKWRRVCRAITTWLATVMLLLPIVILDNVSSPVVRLVTIVISAGFFLSAVSLLTNARTVEIFVTGASYVAVLVVFTSAGNGVTSSKQC